MRILIIGGTGFIGPFVVHQLVEQGHEVTLFHRGQTETDLPAAVHHIRCGDDKSGRMGWKSLLAQHVGEIKRIDPAVVLDMVPLGEADSRIVMDNLQGIAQRIIAISSQDVFRAYGRLIGKEPGPPDPIPLTEDAPLREKIYPYRSEPLRALDDPTQWMDDYDKILAEHVLMGNPDFPGTILRLPMVYGPRDNQHRLFAYLKRMDDQRPAILLNRGEARWRWTRGYVENIAQAIVLAITDQRATGRIYNVGETSALTLHDWVRAIGDVTGWQGEIISVPEERLPAHLSAGIDSRQHLVTDTTRIRQELDYSEAIPFTEALIRTITWERANPPKQIDPKLFDYALEDSILQP